MFLRYLIKNTCFCGSGCDAIYSDIVECGLLTKRFCERDDTGFFSTVAGSSRVTLLSCDRGDIHDAAVIAAQHVWNNCATAKKDSGQVNIDHLLPGIKG